MKPETIDQYLAGFPEDQRCQLSQLRTSILTAVPEAEEKLSWGVPTYYFHGFLVQFAGYAKHLGFYSSPETICFFQEELKPYFTNTKNTVRFNMKDELPLPLIEAMTRYQAALNLKRTSD